MKANSDHKTLVETLQFLADIGEGHVLEESSINRLTTIKEAAQVSIVLPSIEQQQDTNLLVKVSKTEARRKAEELAYNANTLDELYAALLSFEGCSLKGTAIHTVFSDGVPTSDIMFVGEAPGADEDRLGKPFVGQSGQLLDKFLEAAGFSRSKNVYITNTIPWRPPGNRQPTPEENYVCMPFLERHIELVQPKMIVMLGATALKTLHNPKEGIVTLRGQWMPYTTSHKGFTVDTMPIFHPAFLLRSPSQKRLFWRDILSLKLRSESK